MWATFIQRCSRQNMIKARDSSHRLPGAVDSQTWHDSSGEKATIFGRTGSSGIKATEIYWFSSFKREHPVGNVLPCISSRIVNFQAINVNYVARSDTIGRLLRMLWSCIWVINECQVNYQKKKRGKRSSQSKHILSGNAVAASTRKYVTISINNNPAHLHLDCGS